MQKNKQSCHLVLSWWWVRGFAHVGVYKALHEHGYIISSISWTSMGSLVGAMIASGLSPYEIESLCTSKSLRKFLDINLSNWWWFFSLNKVMELLQLATQVDVIEDLSLPLCVCVTDVQLAQPRYFAQWDLKKIISASCAVPWLFDPIEYDNTLFIDGGVTDNFPMQWMLHQDQYMIWVHVNPLPKLDDYTIKDISTRAVEIMLWRAVRDCQSQCDIFIEPPALCQINQSLFVDPSEIIQIWYQYATQLLSQKQ